MEFRVGINMGDVVKEDGNLYGEGVNIAARLEALAKPNGICLSRNIYELVKTKTSFSFSDLGEKKMKNTTVHAFDIIYFRRVEQNGFVVLFGRDFLDLELRFADFMCNFRLIVGIRNIQ